MLNDELYKRGFSQPYLRCVEEEKAKYILEEAHEGICGDHMGARSLVGKIMKVGYFGPRCRKKQQSLLKSVIATRGIGTSNDFQEKR